MIARYHESPVDTETAVDALLERLKREGMLYKALSIHNNDDHVSVLYCVTVFSRSATKFGNRSVSFLDLSVYLSYEGSISFVTHFFLLIFHMHFTVCLKQI